MPPMPFMRFYPADYLAEAGHLSTVEHGAYLRLILNYWQGGGPLPAEDDKLARIAGMSPRAWAGIRQHITELFELTNGRWVHARLETELAFVRSKSLKSRQAALAPARRAPRVSPADAQRALSHTDTDTDKSIPSDKKSDGAAVVSVDPIKALFDRGIALLTASGVPGKQARSLIGKWRKDHGDGLLIEAIIECEARHITDPVEWITARFIRGIQRPRDYDPTSLEATAPAL